LNTSTIVIAVLAALAVALGLLVLSLRSKNRTVEDRARAEAGKAEEIFQFGISD